MKVLIKKSTEMIESKICYLPKNMFNALELSEKILYKLNFGQKSEYTFVMPSERHDKCMYFSSSLFNKLLLYEEMMLNIWRKKEKIYLGPIVGIFVNTRHLKTIKNGKQSFFTQKHAEAGNKTHCLTYYFSIDEINWKEKMIRGYTFVYSLNKWKQNWFPIPNVIYDRGVAFKKEQIPIVKYMRQKFKTNYNIHFINSHGYLSKWKVHKGLSKYSHVKIYLPKTIIYKSFENIISMLKEFKFIFVKASVGWRGKHVLSIEQVDDKYILNFYKNGLKEITLEKKEDLKMFVEKFVKGRKVIIQQGIRLLKYNEHNMDMRVLMIKNGKGEWEAIQNHSRIAKDTFTITNNATGADCISYKDIYPYLSSHFCKRNIPDNDELINATKKILYYIEKEFGSFGEVGMDMAIDIYGDIWFIEANTRPDKLTLLQLYDPIEIPTPALNIFKYAKFLVNNSIPSATMHKQIKKRYHSHNKLK